MAYRAQGVRDLFAARQETRGISGLALGCRAGMFAFTEEYRSVTEPPSEMVALRA
jgi:hypothetical protein